MAGFQLSINGRFWVSTEVFTVSGLHSEARTNRFALPSGTLFRTKPPNSTQHKRAVDCVRLPAPLILEVRTGAAARLRVFDTPSLGEYRSAAMYDRYDPRSSDDRDRDESWQRSFGSRGGSTDRDHPEERHPRDVFTKDLDLPRGPERRPVRARDRVYEIDGTESRLLGTVGAFRVVAESDLTDQRDDSSHARRSLRHLEDEGLIRRSPLSADDRVVVLTERGRDLLESNRHERERSPEPRQAFYAGLRKPRELTHDTKVYRAYQRAEERLRGQGGRVRRVVLDYELKRDYQRFLHERNRGKKDCDGRPDREPEEIARWAREHDLPYDDGHVRFPDARIEYEDRDGRSQHEDLEVVTGHYRGAHAGSAAKSGFTCYLSIRGSVGGRGGGGRHPRIAEELIR
jgi:DNA-binding MarR family transcriptional regulator